MIKNASGRQIGLQQQSFHPPFDVNAFKQFPAIYQHLLRRIRGNYSRGSWQTIHPPSCIKSMSLTPEEVNLPLRTNNQEIGKHVSLKKEFLLKINAIFDRQSQIEKSSERETFSHLSNLQQIKVRS